MQLTPFSYETKVPFQVDAGLVDVGKFKVGMAKISKRYARNYELQPHHTKSPRSAPAIDVVITTWR